MVSGGTESLVTTVQVVAGATTTDLTLRVTAGVRAAEVARTLAAATGSTVERLLLDGAPVAVEADWAQLDVPHGSRLTLGEPADAVVAPAPGTGLEVVVVGGPLSGLSRPLPAGRSTLGRGSRAAVRIPDPMLSREHVQLEARDGVVTVTDLGSTNRTTLDGRLLTGPSVAGPDAYLRAGQSVFCIRAAAGQAARPNLDEGIGGRFCAPSPPPAGRHFRPPWVALLTPLGAGLLIALCSRNTSYLALVGLSPLTALAGHLIELRDAERRGREAQRTHQAAMVRHRAAVDAAIRAQTATRRRACPDLPALLAAARDRTPPLWSRPGGDLVVRVGTSAAGADLVLIDHDHRPLPPPLLPDVPVALDLRRAAVTGFSGAADVRDASVRAVLAQLVALHAPADLHVAVLCRPQRLAAWDWVKWLPHARSVPDDVDAAISVGTDEPGWLQLGRCVEDDPGRTQLFVLDVGDRPAEPPALGAVLRQAREGRCVALVLTEGAECLSRICSTVLRLPDGTGSAAVVSGLDGDMPLEVPDGLAAKATVGLARALAGAGASRRRTSRPPSAGLLGTGEVLSPAAIGERWRVGGPRLSVRLPADAPGGRLVLDLSAGRDGPHLLVCGSGRGEILHGALLQLALARPPGALVVGLTADGPLSRLPHLGEPTGQGVAALLAALDVERCLRLALLDGVGAAGLAEYRASLPDPSVAPPARAAVLDPLPALLDHEAEEQLAALLRDGGRIGVHLLLGSSGVPPRCVLAAVPLRICLRMDDAADVRAVMGVADPISLRLPGEGLAVTAAGSFRIRAGALDHRTSKLRGPGDGPVPPVEVTTFAITPGGPPPTDLERVLTALAGAARLHTDHERKQA